MAYSTNGIQYKWHTVQMAYSTNGIEYKWHRVQMALHTTNMSSVNISFDQMSFEHLPIDQMGLQKGC